MDYVRNKRYFSPGWLVFAGIIFGVGIMVLFAGLITTCLVAPSVALDVMEQNAAQDAGFMVAGVLIVGAVLFVVGLVWVIILSKRRPKEAQIDEQVQEKVKQLYQKALDKHGITEEMVQRSAPLVFGGYVLDEKTTAKLFSKRFVAKTVDNTIGGGKMISTVVDPTVAMGSVMSASVIAVDKKAVIKHMRANADGTVRSDLAEYTIFLFSEDKVFVYTQQFSLVDPEIKETAHKYAYRDIVSISLEALKYGSHAFIVKASNGEILTVPCSNAKATDIKNSVTSFMQIVRDKKNS